MTILNKLNAKWNTRIERNKIIKWKSNRVNKFILFYHDKQYSFDARISGFKAGQLLVPWKLHRLLQQWLIINFTVRWLFQHNWSNKFEFFYQWNVSIILNSLITSLITKILFQKIFKLFFTPYTSLILVFLDQFIHFT